MNFILPIICRSVLKQIVLLLLLASLFVFPRNASSEFYKYVDEKGITHFVDSKSRIPKQYRDDIETYEERYDHLSEEERQKKIKEDRAQAEALRVKRQAELEALREKARIDAENKRMLREKEERALKLEKERAAKEEYLRSLETKIILDGIHTLVPCTLGYDGKDMEVYLLLDTGCTITTVHPEVAKELDLEVEERIRTTIANGQRITSQIAKLDYIKIGPYTVKKFYVSIIPFRGQHSQNSGLLGMNFLAGRDYKIDYAKGVIRWAP